MEEVVQLSLKPKGIYGIYQLTKSGWNTIELLAKIGQMLNKSSSDLDYAGRKDRYARTTQYISIKGESLPRLTGPGFSAERIGFLDRPLGADLLLKNRFWIVVRDLGRQEIPLIIKNLARVTKFGLPNYFDDQRFGSARHHQGFVAKRLIFGHYGGALKLYFTPSKWDRALIRNSKTSILEHWGDWHACLRHARPEDKAIFRYLVSHPKDFERASNHIDHRLMGILVAAYQSFLWNETVKEFLMADGIETASAPYLLGELLFYEELPGPKLDQYRKLLLPVLDHKVKIGEARLLGAAGRVFEREGIRQRDLNFHRYPRVRFRSFERNIIVFPEDLKVAPAEPDEKSDGRWKLTLTFALPKGSYATMLIKRISLDQNRIPS